MDARLSDAVFSTPAAPTLGGPGPPAPVPAQPKPRTARVRVTSEAVGVRGALGGYYRSLPPWIDDLTREFGPETYERMQLDDQVSSSLRALCHGVLSDGLVLRPGVDDDKDPDFGAAKDALSFCERATWGQTGGLDQWLLTMLKGAVGGGNRVSETVCRPEESGRDAGKWLLDRLKVKPRRSVAFAVDSCNNLAGILGLPPGGAAWGGLAWGTTFDPAHPPDNFLPREKFCVLSWDPPDEDPRGSSILRCVYEPWWAKLQAAREWLAYLAQFGSPGLVGTTAPGADSSAPTDAYGNAVDGPVLTPEQDMANKVMEHRNGGVHILPNGATLDVLQTSNAGDAFLKKVDACDRAIAQGINLAMRAVMQSRFGSRADAEQGQDVAGLQTRFMKRWLARMVTEDLLRPLIRINYGPDAARRLSPYASLSPVEHQDLGPSLVAVSGAWKNGLIKNSQLPWVYEQFGMPPATEGELAAPPPGPPAAPGAPPGEPPPAPGGPPAQPPQAPFAYNPDEPRVPAGSPEGGQWGSGGGGHPLLEGALASPRTLPQLTKFTGIPKAELLDHLRALTRAGRLEHGVNARGTPTYRITAPAPAATAVPKATTPGPAAPAAPAGPSGLPRKPSGAVDALHLIAHERYSYSQAVPVAEVAHALGVPEADALRQLHAARGEGVSVSPGRDGRPTAFIDKGPGGLSRLRPEPTTATPAQKAAVKSGLEGALAGVPAGKLVPVHELRAKVPAPDKAAFDDAARSLWREGKVRLVSLADLQKATAAQLDASIPGTNETFFYLEPTASARFSLDAPDLSGLGDLLNLSRQDVLDALFDAALDSFDLALADSAFGGPADFVLGTRPEGTASFGAPDQPRLPAGQAGGGEWTSGGPGKADINPQGDRASPGGAERQVREHYRAWREGLSAGEEKALRDYAVVNYTSVNRVLRRAAAGALEVPPHLRGGIDVVAGAIARSPGLPRNAVLYRGMGGRHLPPGDLTGTELTDPAFLSTSFNAERTVKGHDVEVRINAPAGTKGAYLGGNESEFLLQKGLRLKVIGDETSGGRRVLRVTVQGVSDAPFYSPDQPRVPAGQPGGGRWAGGVSPGMTAARDAASDAVRAFARGQGTPTAAEAEALAGHLARLTVSQIHALKAEHGLKGSAPNKAALVAKLAERFAAWRAGRAPKEAVPDWPADYDVFGKRDVFADEPVDAGTLAPAVPGPGTGLDLGSFDPAKSYAAPGGKEPWEMTRREWDDEWDRVRPDPSGQGGGGGRERNQKRGPGNVNRSIAEHERLKMGLGDVIDPDGEMAPRGARHREVIEAALAAGKPVPARVLADYPDLAAKAAPPPPAPPPAPAAAPEPPTSAASDHVAAAEGLQRATQEAIDAARASVKTVRTRFGPSETPDPAVAERETARLRARLEDLKARFPSKADAQKLGRALGLADVSGSADVIWAKIRSLSEGRLGSFLRAYA
jgi:hypothetical protein